MEWLCCIRKTLDFIETHLTEELSPDALAREVNLSPFFLQRGFSMLTGYSLGEYIRSRRLSCAADELLKTDERVINIALSFGYDTPESFTKAFSRFHGASPSQVRAGSSPPRRFAPLTLRIDISGGNQMDCKIAKMFPLRVIGFERTFDNETCMEEIPKFWNELCEKYAANVYAGNPPASPQEKALMDNCIGEYGVCIDDIGSGRFRYLVAGKYCGGEIPEGMTLYEFPMGDWAIFDCYGPCPQTLQAMTKRIFSEWLPGNPDYELCGSASIEWYDCINGEMTDPDYHSAIWLPVKPRS